MKIVCLLVGFIGEKGIHFTHLEDPGMQKIKKGLNVFLN